jgi:hypothetical protein
MGEIVTLWLHHLIAAPAGRTSPSEGDYEGSIPSAAANQETVMSYRTMVVGGKSYEYVIGKKFLKVKGVGSFLKSEIGCDRGPNSGFEVTPGMISDLIAGRPVRKIEPYTCRHGTTTTHLAASPYASEVYDKRQMMIDCKECLHDDWLDT